MECSEATGLVVQSLLSEGGWQHSAALAEHLAYCPACAARLAAYLAVRDEVRRMLPVQAPAQTDEFVAQGIKRALTEGRRPKRPPADPRPERPGHQKALIVVGALVGLMAVTAALLVAFRGEYEPIPSVAQMALRVGTVEVRTPGAWAWREAGSREFLPPGAQVRTGAESLLRLQGQGAEWWLPPMSAVALADGSSAELLTGRVYVRCQRADGPPVTLTAANGKATCQEGDFVALASMKRLRVGCVSGKVLLGHEGGETALEAGQCALLSEQRLVAPVRKVRAAELTHWLRAFEAYGERHLSARQLAAVPLTPEVTALPDAVAVDELDVDLMVRGPAALVTVAAALRNTGAAPWRGPLRAADLLLPVPLAEANSGDVELAPGAAGRFRSAVLCIMPARNGFHSLGLNPEAWTRRELGCLRLAVDASAAGGIRLFDCPTWDYRVRRPDAVHWSGSRERVSPSAPIVADLQFRTSEGVDVLPLGDGQGNLAVAVWRADPDQEEWLKRDRPVFLALDVTADFGAGGAGYAQQVMETLLGSLPPGCSTALMAYDGALKVAPDRLARHYPARVEVMLQGLWQLQAQGTGRADGFLQAVLNAASGAAREGILVAVTGRQDADRITPAPEPAAAGPLRIVVLQAGATEPTASYRALCAATGGVALALPESAAPDLSAFDLLANLQWPALRQVELALDGDARGAVLRGEGCFSNQPVAALVSLPEGGQVLRGEFRARAGSQHLSREFSLPVGSGQFPGDHELAGALARQLASLLAPVQKPSEAVGGV